MAKVEPNHDPDDMFSETRMTFGEHIEDLRIHLLRAIYGFLIAMVASLFFGKPALKFISAPVEQQLRVFSQRTYLQNINEYRESAGMDGKYLTFQVMFPEEMVPEKFRPQKFEPVLPSLMPAFKVVFDQYGLVPQVKWDPFFMDDLIPVPVGLNDGQVVNLFLTIRPPALTTLNVQEAFIVYFKVSLMVGFVISSPWVFYQIWAFIAAGLYPHEKRLVNVYLPFSLFLFLGGCAVCQFLVMPKAIEALLWFNEWLGLQPDLRLNEWLGFAIFMPLVFGLSFQTPLVMLFLYMIGIFDIESYRGRRKIAWFVMAIFAAVITPSTDAFSMMFLWVPMSLLYELGIFLCLMRPRQQYDEPEPTESEEWVEV